MNKVSINYAIIYSDERLPPVRLTQYWHIVNGTPLIYLREIWTKIHFFSFDEMQLKCRLSNADNVVSVSNV